MILSKEDLKRMIIEIENLVSDLDDPFRSIAFQTLLQYYINHPEDWPLIKEDTPKSTIVGNELFSKITSKTTDYDSIMITLKYIEEILNKKGATASEISDTLWIMRKRKISNIYARLRELIQKKLITKEKKEKNEYLYFRTLRGIEYTEEILRNLE